MSDNLSSLLMVGLTLASAAVMLAASWHDIVARTVPNFLATILALLGLALRFLHGDLPGGLLAGLLVFIAAAFCWRRGWMGGGDVKLLAAAAIAVPPAAVISFIAAVGLFGGFLAMLYLAARRFVTPPGVARPHSLPARALRVERWRIQRGGPLPYACAIAAGGLFILL